MRMDEEMVFLLKLHLGHSWDFVKGKHKTVMIVFFVLMSAVCKKPWAKLDIEYVSPNVTKRL